MKAHQEYNQEYRNLRQEAQLNCQMDYLSKSTILETAANHPEHTRCFPLEPVCVLLGRNKVTSDKGEQIWFWVQWQMAMARFHKARILLSDQFDQVDWEMVHTALRRVPRMFQIRACKQVMDIAPANGNRPWERTLCPLCPSCAQVRETCANVLMCTDAGWVETFMKLVYLILSWMDKVNTDPELRECIVDYAKGRGTLTMLEICHGKDTRFRQMAADQGEIGWKWFMESTVATGLWDIQTDYSDIEGSRIPPT